MIEQTRDAAKVNRIANDPRIFEAVSYGHPYPLDMTRVIEAPGNVTFVGEHGAFIFVLCAPDVYEVHAAVLPEGQGAWTKEAGADALDVIFRDVGARAVLFPCPIDNRAAVAGAVMLGAKRLCENGEFTIYGLTADAWRAN